VLAPKLWEGAIVVMDNVRFHTVAGVCEALEKVGASALYLPPYSPDFNPIERMWSKVKTLLRQAKARTSEALKRAIRAALRKITSMDAAAWIVHDGY
jgi:transposase